MSEPKPKQSSLSTENIVKYSIVLGAIVAVGVGLILFLSKKDKPDKKPPLPKDKENPPQEIVKETPPQTIEEKKLNQPEQETKTPHSSQISEKSFEIQNLQRDSTDSKLNKGSFGDYVKTNTKNRDSHISFNLPEERKLNAQRPVSMRELGDEEERVEEDDMLLTQRTETTEYSQRLTRSELRFGTVKMTQKPFDEPEYKPYNDPEYNNRHPIYFEQSVKRSGLLANAAYEVALNLGKEDYEGYVKITFDLRQASESLYLDAHVSTVKRVILNNVEQDPAKVFSTHSIELPQQDLLHRMNVVEIFFKNHYSKGTDGLQHYTDSNQLEYIWSKNGPVSVHRIFPCFDQPDIKAIVQLFVFVPQPFAVTSNGDISSVYAPGTKAYKKYDFLEDFNVPRKIWEFKETPPIPLHHFKLFAGYFDEIPCTSLYKEIKMSIFCRKGLKTSFKEPSEHLFEAIVQCMKYFEDLFGCSFPFPKYDMVVLPDEALVGSVITAISEQKLLSIETGSDVQRFSLVYEALRDLAYTWYGAQIAFHWWDESWFAKSFSTFAAHDALETLAALKDKYPDSWVHFFYEKDRAYAHDHLPSSHPISVNLKDTSKLETELDEVSYIKGAACIKQLAHAVGLDKFWGAVNIFFAKFAWKNATFDDFLREVEVQAKDKQLKADLDRWKKDWLSTAGYNLLSVDWEPTAEGKLESITIRQEACGEAFPHTRTHRVQIGFFDSEGNVETMEVRVDEHTKTISNLPIQTLPVAILLNYNDYGYAKIKLDDKSLPAYGPIFTKIENIIARALIWDAQIDMVHDRNASCVAFIEALTKSIDQERHPLILRNLLTSADYMISNYLSSSLKNKKSSELFHKLQQIVKLESWELNAKEIDIYLERFASFAREKDDIMTLLKWFKNESSEMGVRPPRPSEQWQILSKAFAANLLTQEKLQELINIIQDDPKIVNAYKAAFETLEKNSSKENREELWQKYLVNASNLSHDEWEYIAQGFNNEFSPEQYDPFIGAFFDSLLEIYTQVSWTHFNKYYKCLFPSHSEEFVQIIEKIEQVLGLIITNDIVQEGFESLAKLLNGSLEETRRRRACFFVNNSQQENLRNSFFEILSPQLKHSMQNTNESSDKLNESKREIEENKRATQLVIENLESIVKTEENTPDGHDIEEPEEEEEEKTVINRSWRKHDTMKIQISASFFKDWTPNNRKKYSKMFRTDANRFTILQKQFASNQSMYEAILDMIEERYYIKLVQIFLHLQADSVKYPHVAFNDIFAALKKAKIFNRTLALSDPEKMIAMQLKESPRNLGGIKETNLLRFEFIELVLRMGIKKYPNESQRIENLEKFLEKDIISNFEAADYDYEGYRYEKVQTQMINDLLQHWIEQIRKKFDEIKQINAEVVTLKALTSYLKQMRVPLIDQDIIKCFALSKMLIVDELSEDISNSYTVLNFPEFLEFLIRIAEALDESKDRTLPDKVQRIFPTLL